ncbi:MAG TPA: 5-(carboxyamino)imidazole ribonucleotide mutase [Bacteroidota bacterium]|nr:5-(carboxyamino)imidazole ribonucleotide mutase [Bacteroidota bacterium]
MKSQKSSGKVVSPLVAVLMGSTSDLEHMAQAREILQEFEVPCEVKVLSAHRTPDLMFRYAEEAAKRGIEVIIAGAGGAAHLPGMLAAKTHLPIIGVPVKSKALNGIDSLLSIVQMPSGVPVATVGIDGAANAGLLAIRILAIKRPELVEKLEKYRKRLEQRVIESKL